MSGRLHALPLSVAAMECCWLAALLLAIDAVLASPHGPALGAFALVYLAAHALASMLRRLDCRAALEWVLCIGLLMLLLWTIAVMPLPGAFHEDAMPGPDKRRFAVQAVSAIAWVRGWRLQHRNLAHDDVAAGFHFGLIALIPAAMMKQAGVELAVLTGAFVVFALLAQWQAQASQQSARFGSRLAVAAMALIALLGVVLAGLALTALVDRHVLLQLLTLPAWLAEHIGWLWSYTPDESLIQADTQDVMRQDRQERPLVLKEPPPWLRWLFALFRGHEALLGVLVSGVLVAILLFFLWCIYRSLRRQVRVRTPGLRYERSGAGLRDALRRAWLQWRDRILALALRLGQRAGALASVWRADHSVRGVYPLALRRLARKGLRRARHESPEEYLRRVLLAWPGSEAGVRGFKVLTAAFVVDRYGPPRRDAAGAQRVNWRRLRKDLNALKRVPNVNKGTDAAA